MSLLVEELSNELMINQKELVSYILSSPYRYKIYQIPKKGQKGKRTIAQPTKELKFLQKHVLNKYLSKLPIHKSCTAYKKRSSIRNNVLPHIKINIC